MPVPRAYHGSAWFVDPENLNLYRIIGEDITEESISLSELTSGQYRAVGGAIRDAGTGRIVQPLPPLYPAQLNVMESGQLIFSRIAAPSAVNAPTATASRRGAQAVAEVTLPTGQVRQVEVGPWLSGSGNRVIVRDGSLPGDDYRFHTVSLFDEAGNAIEPEVPPGWRYATPEETIDRGLASELLHTRIADLREMVALGMVGPDGEPITDLYEAALYVAGQMAITPSISSVLG